MKQISLDENGLLKHVWIKGIHSFPDDSISVADDVVVELLNSRNTKAYVNGKVINYSAAFVFENALTLKLQNIVSAYKQAMSPIRENYTDEEIASFPTQEAEAKAWDADNNSPTPLLDYMLAERTALDKATLVSRILQNAVIYKQIAGPAIGRKQYYEDLLYALKAQHEDPEQPDVTQADIDAIVVDFSAN